MEGIVVTGLFTLVAALSGVWITQRHQERQAKEARAEARRAAQRRVLTDLIIATHQKIDTYLVLLPAVAGFTEQDRATFIETDTGRRLREINDEMSRALAEARLFVGDEPLTSRIERLRTHDSLLSDIAFGDAARWRRSTDKPAGMDIALDHLTEMKKALVQVENAAIDLLRVPVRGWPSRVRPRRWSR